MQNYSSIGFSGLFVHPSSISETVCEEPLSLQRKAKGIISRILSFVVVLPHWQIIAWF